MSLHRLHRDANIFVWKYSTAWKQWIGLLQPSWWKLTEGALCVILGRILSIVLAVIGGMLVDGAIRRKGPEGMVQLLLAGVVVVVLQVILIRFSVIIVSGEAQRIMSGVRKRLISHVLRLPLPLFEVHLTGALSSQIMADTESLRTVFSTGMIDMLGSLSMAVTAFLVLIKVSQTLAAGIALTAIPFAIGVLWALRRLRKLYVEKSIQFGALSGRVTEALGGIRVLKALGAEEHESGIIVEKIEGVDIAERKFYTVTSILGCISVLTIGICTLWTMMLGGQSLMHGTMSPGSYFVCLLLLSYIVLPLMQTLSVGAQVAVSLAAIGRMGDLFARAKEGAGAERQIELTEMRGEVQFDEVSFSYEPTSVVLQNVSFRAVPGTITAIVGPSGAGKTTMMNLLCGFASPKYGSITIDGVDLNRVDLQTYRTQLGIVLQDTFLFSGTVYENVLYAKPSASRDEVLNACRLAHVEEFIHQLPQGYETHVGERGVLLSGGQKQRISIARAILVDPKILILDEATANIDAESESYLRESYAQLRHGRTVFVISHRLSAIRDADLILVLRRGRIAEIGRHDELLRRQGLYFRLFSYQDLRAEAC
jgi:ABC-type multidrug transport system fused ATPase/permease subunit